jgi:hypothetical protein
MISATCIQKIRDRNGKINDPYLDEVIETQGDLFEEVVYSGGDLVDFTNKFMNSKMKRIIDERGPIHTNMIWNEQLECLEKEGIKVKELDKNDKYPFNDYMIANWIGEFYAYMQWYTQMYSSYIIKIAQ